MFRALLAVEKFNTNILAPACGGGAISETAKTSPLLQQIRHMLRRLNLFCML
nr:MAG TPA: hypothetical protein [Caudoviricetes sp.]